LDSINASIAQAKNGAPEDSRRFLEALQTKIRPVPFYRESWLLLESMLNAALSYSYYRLRLIDLAEVTIRNAMSVDEELETSYGWHSRHLHRIHMVENRARVYFRSGALDKCVSVLLPLLIYLGGSCDDVPFPGRWSREMLEKVDRPDLEIKALGICTALAVACTDLSPESWTHHRDLIVAGSHSQMPLLSEPSSVKYWLRSKEMLLLNRDDEYSQVLEEWLRSDARISPDLFGATLLDVKAVASRNGLLSTFLAEIQEGVHLWKEHGQHGLGTFSQSLNDVISARLAI